MQGASNQLSVCEILGAVRTHATVHSSLHVVRVEGITAGHHEHVIDWKLSDTHDTLVTGAGGSEREVTDQSLL